MSNIVASGAGRRDVEVAVLGVATMQDRAEHSGVGSAMSLDDGADRRAAPSNVSDGFIDAIQVIISELTNNDARVQR